MLVLIYKIFSSKKTLTFLMINGLVLIYEKCFQNYLFSNFYHEIYIYILEIPKHGLIIYYVHLR
jgi:hypothetical protein